ncbi:ATPase family protein associated with various cellular activities (AAA) [Kribbella orskensis]|uniref:ATPase family protein associated with various cellular activities (AAA) n=1 Tax=Kribbella orskensis TaxID=2512216 RepID=A0ABY2BE25_9ACTN|nr:MULTISPECIES: ATP-binding protein [Kribbella]TCN35866.1 ATPase family protein associated with various cellular activities (AAA) [Kribbella sp. VKM Ac-2500]TCO17473.1 ATPase family protein associated with various cellular activities (AAA) [Kribbella orskensis]
MPEHEQFREREEIDEFARLFTGFLERMQLPRVGAGRENLRERLLAHLGVDPEGLPVIESGFPPFDLPNVQLALEAWFDTFEVIGLAGQDRNHYTLSELLEVAEQRQYGVGAVDYERISIDVDERMDCVAFGFYLGVQGDERYVALLRKANPQYGRMTVQLEVLATGKEAGERFLGALPDLVREHNVFRGKVVSFEGHDFGNGVGPFLLHRRPNLSREDVVLPPGVLERVEREVIGIAEHRETLLRAGQHLRRGVLLYGPPGTGKTHTVRYLLSRLPSFTVVLLAGISIRYIAEACALARMLEPALVVLEDCDLIAESRDHFQGGNALLFQVLNEMDGLAEEADVAFLLTTNRADVLEPALVQRPGRIDLAVEVPLPDSDGRARLLSLYGPGLEFSQSTVDEVVAQTEGTTASFARELVRRAVLLAAENGSGSVGDAELRAAAGELLSSQDALTRRLLGSPGPT